MDERKIFQPSGVRSRVVGGYIDVHVASAISDAPKGSFAAFLGGFVRAERLKRIMLWLAPLAGLAVFPTTGAGGAPPITMRSLPTTHRDGFCRRDMAGHQDREDIGNVAVHGGEEGGNLSFFPPPRWQVETEEQPAVPGEMGFHVAEASRPVRNRNLRFADDSLATE